jgi:hypothetical protein
MTLQNNLDPLNNQLLEKSNRGAQIEEEERCRYVVDRELIDHPADGVVDDEREFVFQEKRSNIASNLSS